MASHKAARAERASKAHKASRPARLTAVPTPTSTGVTTGTCAPQATAARPVARVDESRYHQDGIWPSSASASIASVAERDHEIYGRKVETTVGELAALRELVNINRQLAGIERERRNSARYNAGELASYIMELLHPPESVVDEQTGDDVPLDPVGSGLPGVVQEPTAGGEHKYTCIYCRRVSVGVFGGHAPGCITLKAAAAASAAQMMRNSE